MEYKFIESYYVILIIIILTIISIIVSRNKIKRASINIKKNKSLIEVYLKERFDLIPNLVEVVKAYSKYENEVLKQINSNNVIKIKDITAIQLDLNEISKEKTLRGIFVKELLNDIKDDKSNKDEIYKIIEIGLSAMK